MLNEKIGRLRWFLFAFLALTPGVVVAQDNCASLLQLKVPHTAIHSAQIVTAASIKVPANVLPAQTFNLQASCRVKAESTPTADSKIEVEVWMPVNTWNGVLVQAGNGGLAGSISYPAMLQHLSRNYAVAATDDGHEGGGTDGSWAIAHPEKVVDFGYRAVHETHEVAAQLIAAFYGHAALFAYFNGCSEGGREALMEAQRFPDDFNGILAGSPGHAWTQLMANFAWNSQALLKDPASYIPIEKRSAIEKAALKACGTQDGVKDEFIKDPLACHFDPSVLLCKASDADDCLTLKQITALKKIYQGPQNPKTGQQISPGYEPGAEAEPGPPGISYSSYVFGPTPKTSLDLLFSSSFYGGFVFGNPHYNSLDLDFGKDSAAAEKVGAILNATSPDLKAFKKHGGKLLQYHGWNDGSPAPLQSINYYQEVVSTMGGLKHTVDFYRLFMVPGMMHCGLGPGPEHLRRSPRQQDQHRSRR